MSCRAQGGPAQPIQGNPEQPIGFQLQWSSVPEWLPVNHITRSADRAEEIPQLIDGQTPRLKPSDGS